MAALRARVSQHYLRYGVELRLRVGHIVHVEREGVTAALDDEAIVEAARQQFGFDPDRGIADAIDGGNFVARYGDVDTDLAQRVDLCADGVGQLRNVPRGQRRDAALAWAKCVFLAHHGESRAVRVDKV